MARKLNYDDVYEFFKKNNCELLEDAYVNNTTKMKFRCVCGDIGEKGWSDYRKAPRCSKCSRRNSLMQLDPAKNKRRLTFSFVKEFIETESECILISDDYVNNSEKLKLKCGCGELFYVSFAKFKDRGKHCCNDCSRKNRAKKLSYGIDKVRKFVEDSSGCKLLSDDYLNNDTLLDFECACGKEFSKTFSKFKDRDEKQCRECGYIEGAKSQTFTMEKAREIVENKGCKLKSNEYKNAKTEIVVECSCGVEFKTTLDTFQRSKNRCDKCTNSQSSYELRVEEFLEENNQTYIREYVFDDCCSVNSLPFDFVVMNGDEIDCLIEVDGQGHYNPVNFGGVSDEQAMENFKGQKHRDKIKDVYCEENGLLLIRIPYYEINQIEDVYLTHLAIDNIVPTT